MNEPAQTSVIQLIVPRARDLGDVTVRRVLPFAGRRMIGPFIFLDHIGPVDFVPGAGMDVRPHPHVNLATVTYLFEGSILHRDSLGSFQVIRPGDVNWMTAGRGIVHSERTPPAIRAAGQRLHGLQIWVALPREDEECAPAFRHYPAAGLPRIRQDGVALTLIAGTAFGMASPVEAKSPMLYADLAMERGARLVWPAEQPERALYLVEGGVRVDGQAIEPATMPVFAPGAEIVIEAVRDSRLALLGGEPFPEPRHLWWNFVSSRAERIEQAKADWKAMRFPLIPDDQAEFIPLPDDPPSIHPAHS